MTAGAAAAVVLGAAVVSVAAAVVDSVEARDIAGEASQVVAAVVQVSVAEAAVVVDLAVRDLAQVTSAAADSPAEQVDVVEAGSLQVDAAPADLAEPSPVARISAAQAREQGGSDKADEVGSVTEGIDSRLLTAASSTASWDSHPTKGCTTSVARAWGTPDSERAVPEWALVASEGWVVDLATLAGLGLVLAKRADPAWVQAVLVDRVSVQAVLVDRVSVQAVLVDRASVQAA